MINFNEQLSQADAKWIIEDVLPKVGYRINHDTLVPWRDAHNKSFKEQVSIPGCSCEYVATYNVWSSRIHQYSDRIRAIAYPVVEEVQVKTTRGKKKNNV